jgi:hypothetical protein
VCRSQAPSLVRCRKTGVPAQALEERGIGRPSTYAPTLQLLQVCTRLRLQLCHHNPGLVVPHVSPLQSPHQR